MNIRKIDTSSPADRKAFCSLPFNIYRNNSYWVPPFETEMALALDRQRHPMYQHSTADFFVVESGNEVVGRIAAIHNQNYCNFHQEKIGFLYYFEAENDLEISRLLFAASFDWARQRGLDHLVGPKGMIRSSGTGLLIDGFELYPALGIIYNQPYYASMWEDSGMVKLSDYASGYMTRDIMLPDKIHEMADKVRRRGNFWTKIFKDPKEIKAWIPKIEVVHEEAFSRNPSFHPSTHAEFQLMASNLMAVHRPGLMKLIMCGDDVAGFVITHPDPYAALQRTKGKLYPFGWLDILMEMKRTKVGDLNGIGILPKYQGMGANILVYDEMDKTLRATKWERAEFVQVDERNFKSKSDMETMGVKFNKVHRLFNRSL
jgi:hypothetical protein